jgi:hypothetical protein
MPTKERRQRELAKRAQIASQQAQRDGLPPGLSQVIGQLRAAGVPLLVQVAQERHAVDEKACELQSAINSPEPAREIPMELDMLHHAISELSLVYEALDARLVPISTPVMNGSAASDQACSAPSLSGLGDQIRAARQRIQSVTASVLARTERLGV